MAGATVQAILRIGWELYRQTHKLPAYVIRAAERMRDCRTAALGGHVKRCPCGHLEKAWYNSCKHRSCPQCGYLDQEKWLSRRSRQILACDHYHTIFTLPKELNDLWRYNRWEFTTVLFHAVRDTLLELLGDEKYLGARPGMLLGLHTWSSNLFTHLHIHGLVMGGGLRRDGRWLTVRKKCLLPRKVLMIKFRGKLLCYLRRALEKGQLQPPPGRSSAQVKSLLNKLGRKVWNVKIQDRYEHGRGVLTYLARYLRGGPISNKRILSCRDGRVTFRVRDYRDLDDGGRPRTKPITLPIDEFIKRLLEHVPLPGMQTVRGYGLYANNKAEELALCRELLGQPPAEPPEALTAEQALLRLPKRELETCPKCGRPATLISLLPNTRDPPCRKIA